MITWKITADTTVRTTHLQFDNQERLMLIGQRGRSQVKFIPELATVEVYRHNGEKCVTVSGRMIRKDGTQGVDVVDARFKTHWSKWDWRWLPLDEAPDFVRAMAESIT